RWFLLLSLDESNGLCYGLQDLVTWDFTQCEGCRHWHPGLWCLDQDLKLMGFKSSPFGNHTLSAKQNCVLLSNLSPTPCDLQELPEPVE
ncbi:hypothetical protein D4764_01G0013520, partial [Takifugu flavidus]